MRVTRTNGPSATRPTPDNLRCSRYPGNEPSAASPLGEGRPQRFSLVGATEVLSSRETSSRRCIDLVQAAFHSALVMCVAASQNCMQSESVRPPPPAILGVASLGLVLAGLAESTRAAPPAVKIGKVAGAESGAVTCTWSAGAAIAGVGAAAGVLGAAGSCDVKLIADSAARERWPGAGSAAVGAALARPGAG